VYERISELDVDTGLIPQGTAMSFMGLMATFCERSNFAVDKKATLKRVST